jgi:hypothetical protein
MSFAVSKTENCSPNHLPPVIVDPNDITLACGATDTKILFTGTGTV